MIKTNNNYFILTLAVLLCYSPVYFANYAFSDDWYYLFSAQMDRAGILKWDVLSGRPVYGIIRYLCATFIDDVSSLKILRLLSVSSLCLLSCFICHFITKRDLLQNHAQRLAFTLSLSLLPSFQVFSAWSVCFPYIAAVLFSALSYSLLVSRLNFWRIIFTFVLLSTSFAIYQPAAMCFLFFAFLDNSLGKGTPDRKKLSSVIAVLIAGMLMALFLSRTLPFLLYQEVLSRTSITTEFTAKLIWFIKQPLTNAICNFDLGKKVVYLGLSLLFIGLGLKKLFSQGS
ncbi:MAG: hypothetical protein XXXJIFNMEKO3_01176 [Candidatus Erwinia impunctatus]|nr:hypothetical protein XXXJIFNMEKO_01176 [Culicoides impunctatus]